jgi:hypothetical protein
MPVPFVTNILVAEKDEPVSAPAAEAKVMLKFPRNTNPLFVKLNTFRFIVLSSVKLVAPFHEMVYWLAVVMPVKVAKPVFTLVPVNTNVPPEANEQLPTVNPESDPATPVALVVLNVPVELSEKVLAALPATMAKEAKSITPLPAVLKPLAEALEPRVTLLAN